MTLSPALICCSSFLLFGQELASGQIIAYQTDSHIGVADLSGGKVVRRDLTPGTDPAISPDGKKIAFTQSDDAGDRRIAIADVTTGAVTVVKGIPGKNEFMPVWSSDGKQLYFNHFLESEWALASVDAEGGNFRLVLEKGSRQAGTFGPFPGGKEWLCHDLESFFVLKLEDQNKVTLADIAKTGALSLSMPGHLDVSPDGKSALFERSVEEDVKPDDEGPPSAVFLIDLSSGKTKRLTPKGANANCPAWLPGGKDYLFSGFDPESSSSTICRAPLDGSTPPVILLKGASHPTVARP